MRKNCSIIYMYVLFGAVMFTRFSLRSIVVAFIMLFSISANAWHAHGGVHGFSYGGGHYYNHGHYHHNYYGYGNRYYGAGWGGPGFYGVPGGYYGGGCSYVRQCYPNGCVLERVCY